MLPSNLGQSFGFSSQHYLIVSYTLCFFFFACVSFILLPNWKMRMSGGLWFIQFCLSFTRISRLGGEVSHNSIDCWVASHLCESIYNDTNYPLWLENFSSILRSVEMSWCFVDWNLRVHSKNSMQVCSSNCE